MFDCKVRIATSGHRPCKPPTFLVFQQRLLVRASVVKKETIQTSQRTQKPAVRFLSALLSTVRNHLDNQVDV